MSKAKTGTLFCCLLILISTSRSGRLFAASSDSHVVSPADAALFSQPGQMVRVSHGSLLSLYCIGKGHPTIVLEIGFGGGAAVTWYRLQPRLAQVTRTCSYDRAGYGFSTLGRNLPRDLNHMVKDLATMLKHSGEPTPYLFMGHSNGGYVISAYARLHPTKIAGMVFLDAALALPEDLANVGVKQSSPIDASLREHLAEIRACLSRAKAGLVPAPGDRCVDPSWYSGFPHWRKPRLKTEPSPISGEPIYRKRRTTTETRTAAKPGLCYRIGGSGFRSGCLWRVFKRYPTRKRRVLSNWRPRTRPVWPKHVRAGYGGSNGKQAFAASHETVKFFGYPRLTTSYIMRLRSRCWDASLHSLIASAIWLDLAFESAALAE